MAGTTTNATLPYPTGSDLVRDGDNAIAQLAQRLDGSSGAFVSVPFAVSAGAVSMPAVTANGGSQTTVTFPAGRFTQAPQVIGVADSNGYGFATTSAPSTSGVTVRYYNPTGTAPTGPIVRWLAVQMTSSSANG